MLAIINGKTYVGTGKVYEKATILVENGIIKEIGENVSVPADAQIIDAEGKQVYPGFIEAHTHATLMSEPRITGAIMDVNEASNPITPEVSIIDAIDPDSEALDYIRRGGFSTVMILPGSAHVVGGEGVAVKTAKKVTVDEMIIEGTQVMKMAFGENPRGAFKDKIKTRMNTSAILRDLLSRAVEYADAKDAGKAPKFDSKLEAMIPVVRGTKKCRIHCHKSMDIMNVIRICQEFKLNFALEHCTDSLPLASRLAEMGVFCTIGPLLSGPYKNEVWHRSAQLPGKLVKQGVKICLTEDSSIATKLLPIHIGICIKEGLPWEEALKAITINAAENLGIADKTGSLEIGKQADISIWDGDPFCNYSTCNYTIIDGEVYKHDHKEMAYY